MPFIAFEVLYGESNAYHVCCFKCLKSTVYIYVKCMYTCISHANIMPILALAAKLYSFCSYHRVLSLYRSFGFPMCSAFSTKHDNC